MKVTNWRRKFAAALLAGGMWVPSMAFAQDIPLGDPSFENYLVGAAGYAYSDAYRPTSAWVDDLDSPPDGSGGPQGYYIQDDGNSNWLYDAAYAAGTIYPTPRTGIQAMHGVGYYNSQETSAVFEAGKTYTFSLWHQADSDADFSGVWMYLFDGSIPFSQDNSLSFRLHAPSPMGNWQQIKLFHTVLPGAPEVGHPVGVSFVPRSDSAVDDASLRADPSESILLFLEVNTGTGSVVLKNLTGQTVHIDDYQITSAAGSLNASGWNSFQDPAGNPPGFPSGNNSGNGWEEADASNENALGESYLTGSSGVPNGASISLGSAFSVGEAQDLVFEYGAVLGTAVTLEGDYNEDNVVDAADYVVWRKNNINGQQGYNTWRTNFGRSGGVTGPSTLFPGFVRYVASGAGASAVPEPASVVFVGMGFAVLAMGRRRDNRAL
jgi:hypothetical protein